MKYYRIHSSDLNKVAGFECYIPSENPWSKESMLFGRPIKSTFDLPIKYEASNKKKLIDMPWSARQFIISTRLKKVFETIIDGYQSFKSEIYSKDGKLLSSDYYSFIFTNSYPAINWLESDCENDDGLAGNIKKLVLSSEKLNKIPTNEKAFRMGEHLGHLISSQEAKDTIKNAGIDTVYFQEIEVV